MMFATNTEVSSETCVSPPAVSGSRKKYV